MKKIGALFFILCIFSLSVKAQKIPPQSLQIEGLAKKHKKGLYGAVISVYKENKIIQQVQSEKDGYFQLFLPYGANYKVSFAYPGCVDMHLLVDTKIPPAKYNTDFMYSIDVPFY